MDARVLMKQQEMLVLQLNPFSRRLPAGWVSVTPSIPRTEMLPSQHLDPPSLKEQHGTINKHNGRHYGKEGCCSTANFLHGHQKPLPRPISTLEPSASQPWTTTRPGGPYKPQDSPPPLQLRSNTQWITMLLVTRSERDGEKRKRWTVYKNIVTCKLGHNCLQPVNKTNYENFKYLLDYQNHIKSK